MENECKITNYSYLLRAEGYITDIDLPLGYDACFIKTYQGYLLGLIDNVRLMGDGIVFFDCDLKFYMDWLKCKHPDSLCTQTTIEFPFFRTKEMHKAQIQLVAAREGCIRLYLVDNNWRYNG